jgi:hypothetical protein
MPVPRGAGAPKCTARMVVRRADPKPQGRSQTTRARPGLQRDHKPAALPHRLILVCAGLDALIFDAQARMAVPRPIQNPQGPLTPSF